MAKGLATQSSIYSSVHSLFCSMYVLGAVQVVEQDHCCLVAYCRGVSVHVWWGGSDLYLVCNINTGIKLCGCGRYVCT